MASRKSKVLSGFLALMLGILQFHGLSAARAEGGFLIYQEGPADRDNFENLPPDYDITQISFGVEEDYPDMYEFFITFINPILPNQFDGTDGSFASLMIDIDGDGEEDYSLDTSDDSYVENKFHYGILTDRRNGRIDSLKNCDVETWTNIKTRANWIAFAIPKDCLPFGSTFGILGYAGSDVGQDNFDYSGNEFWTINPTESDITEVGAEKSSGTDLPFLTNDRVSVIPNPADAPGDLSSLSRGISDSVVTILCEDGIGSGWSASVGLTQTMIDEGVESYIITNHHVIEECTDGRQVDVYLESGDKVAGRVVSWDPENDLAGIVTKASIQGLDWVGPEPAQGWWVGVIGSPLGQPGILTTGIASSVPNEYVGFMSAPINRGNSGGPVFDNLGRVIGVATFIMGDAQGRDAQGFNVYQGTPLLCIAVIECSSSDIWAGSSGSLFPTGASLYVPLLLLATGAIVLTIVLTRRRTSKAYAAPIQNQNFRSAPGTQQIPGAIIRPGSMPPPPPGSMPPPPPGSMPPPPPGR